MKKFLVPSIASLLMLGSSPVWAWSQVTGSINSIDPKAHEITLDNGTTYKLQASVDVSTLAAGDKVTVNTETKNGQQIVNKVTKSG
jgi:Cu/Ag efflux protein CusF